MRDPAFQPSLENLEPINSSTPAGGFPGGATAYPPAPNPNLRSPLPPTQQTSVDQLRQFYRVGTPQNRVLPLQPNASAATNAAAQTVAAATASSNVSIGLVMPKEFEVAGSRADGSGTFDVTWAPEPAFTVLTAGASLIGGYFDAASFSTGISSTPVNATLTSQGPNEVAFFLCATNGAGANTPNLGPAWSLVSTAPVFGIYGSFSAQFVPLGGTVTASTATSIGSDFAGILAFFGASQSPVFVQVQSVIHTSTAATVTLSAFSSVTVGNSILVLVMGNSLNPFMTGLSVTDTLSNSYTLAAGVNDGLIGGCQSAIFLCPVTVAGAPTISLHMTGGSGDVTIVAYEVAHLQGITSFPAFRLLTPDYIPPIELDLTNQNGGVTGILGVGNGGTGSDLSATGGTHDFVKQASTGAALTVAQPAFSDISGTITPATQMPASGVTAGSYTSTNLTVNAEGLITAASNGSGGGGGGVNAQTTSYTAVSGDAGKIISFNSASVVTLTLPASPPSSTWAIYTEDVGAGTLTVDRNGLNIDGAASNLSVPTGQGVYISTDGSNYFTERGLTSASAGVSSLNSLAGALSIAAGSGITVTPSGSTITIAASGGAGIPTGSNVCSLSHNPIGQDNGYSGLSILLRIPRGCITNQATKVKLDWNIKSGTQTVGAAVIRTLPPGSNTFNAGSTAITWASSSTPTLTAGDNVSDAITFTIDGTVDVCFILFFSSASSDILNTYSDLMGLISAGTSTKYSGWASGNQTAVSTYPSLTPEVAGWAQITTA